MIIAKARIDRDRLAEQVAAVYPDGSQLKHLKALCELRGYVFDAWLRMADVFEVLGEPERANDLYQKANEGVSP